MNTTQKKTRKNNAFSLLMLSLITISSFFITTCKAPFGLGGQVDIALPVVTILSPQPNSYFGRSFEVRGEASDDIEVKAVFIDILQNNQVKTTVQADYSDGTFFAEVLTLDENDQVIVPDGQVTLRVRALDQRALDNANDRSNVRHSGVSNVAVIVDNRAPTTLVTVPQFLANPAEDSYPLTSTYFIIKGEAWDPSGISRVDVLILDADQNVLARKTADGTASWLARFTYSSTSDFPVALANGLYSYLVVVEDKAGNESRSFFHYEDIATIRSSGSDFPSVDELGRADQLGLNPSSGSFLVGDLPEKLRSTQFRIDSDEDKPKIRFSNLSIENPPVDNVIGRLVPILGSITDEQDGIDESSISAVITEIGGDGTTFTVPSAAIITTRIGGGSTVNYEIYPRQAMLGDDDFIVNGSYTIQISAKDGKFSNQATQTATASFMVDSSAPSILEIVPVPQGGGTFIPLISDAITVSAKITDDNGVDSVSFVIKTRALDSDPFEVLGTVPGTALAGSRYQIVYTLPAMYLALPKEDRTPLYVDIIAYDVTGKRAVYPDIKYLVSDDFPVTPTIIIPSDAPNNQVSGEVVSIRGTAGTNVDDVNKATKIFYHLGATADTVAGVGTPDLGYVSWQDGTVTFKTTLPKSIDWTGPLNFVGEGLPEGQYRLFVYSQNDAGLYSTAPAVKDFWLDHESPALSILVNAVPDVSSLITNAAVNFSGTVSDSNGIASFGVTINSGAFTPITPVAGNWTWTLPLAAGSYNLEFAAVDGAGRRTAFTKQIQIDTTNPTVVITTANNSLSGKSSGISGTASDNVGGSGILKVEYRIDAGTWADASGISPWFVSHEFPTEGAYVVNVRSVDRAGNNSAIGSINLRVDEAVPVIDEIEINTPVLQTKNTAFAMQGTATDSHGIADIVVSQKKDNGESTIIGSGADGVSLGGSAAARTWLIENLPRDPNLPGEYLLADGLYEYTITVIDLSGIDKPEPEEDIPGRSSSVIRTVRLDTTGPALTITNPSAASWISNNYVTVTGIASDVSGIQAVYYKKAAAEGSLPASVSYDDPAAWTAAGWIAATGTADWSFPLTGMVEGQHSVWLRAVDTANNISGSRQLEFGVDLNLPALSASTPASSTRSLFTLTGTASDTNALAPVAITVSQKKDSAAALPIGVNGPETLDGWANWTLSNLPRNPADLSAAAPLNASSDGEYEYVITVTDVAGKTREIIRTVRFDRTLPSVVVSNPASDGDDVGSTYKFEGTASDTDGSGIKKVQYSFDNSIWNDTVGAANWSINTIMSGTEGPRTFYVQAEDNAGNIGVSQRSFIYDSADPLLSVDGAVLRSENGKFQISGTASDSYGIDRIEVEQRLGAGAYQLISGSHYILSGSAPNYTWQIGELPRKEGTPSDYELADGLFTYRITAYDDAGKPSSQRTVTVTIDQTAPELLEITSPAVGKINTDALNGSAFTLRGNADDSGVGMDFLYYAITGSPVAPDYDAANIDANYLKLATVNGPWSVLVNFGTGGGAASIDAGVYTLPEGTWHLHVLAEDSAGNRGASVLTRTFDVDQSLPAITALQIDAAVFSSGIYKAIDYTISFTATDTYALSGYTVTRNGTYIRGTAGSPVVISGASAPVSLVEDVSLLSDGSYEYIITVYDLMGKAASLSRTVIIDQTPPVLVITAPVAGEGVGVTDYTIRGTVTDNSGIGVSDLEYSIDSTDGVDGTWTAITKAFSWNVAAVNFGPVQGPKTLWVRADDSLNPPTVESVSLYFDTANPVLTETLVNTDAQQMRNAAIVYEGIASDTYQLDTLTVSVNGAAAISITVELDDSWTYTLPAVNGDYTLVFTAEDIAGRTTNLTRRALIDASAPALPVINAFTGTYVTNSLVASGTAADTGAPASGLAVAQYSFNGTGLWSALSGTENWFGTLDISALAQGDHTLDVRTTDRAGNVSTEASRSFTIDRADPVLTVNVAYTGTVYRSSAFTIDGNISDTLGLGTSPVSVSVNGPSGLVDLSGNPISYNSGTGVWSQTVPIAQGQGTYTLTITAADAVGRFVIATRTVIVDTAPPSLTISNLTENQLIQSSSYTVSGTAADGTGSGVALVQYSLNGGSTWLDATGTSSWTILLDPLAQTLAGNILLRTRDQAGNQSGETSRNFRVDTANPALAVTAGNTAASLVYLNSAMLLSGTATDANNVTSIVVNYSYNGAAAVELLNDTDNNGVWSTSLSPLADGSQDGEYVFTIVATDGAGKTSTLVRQVQYDTTVPGANYTTVTPLLDGNMVNGKVTVRAAVADETSLNTVHWALLPSASSPIEADYVEIVSGSKTSPQWVLDTTLAAANVSVNGTAAVNGYLSDGQASRLWVRARDRAGNETLLSLVLNVDQVTDYPTIEFIAIDTSAATPADSYKNLIESNAVLRFTISDDDMIQASSIEIRVDGGSWTAVNRNGGAALTDSQTLTTSHNLSLPTTITEGTHYFELRVSDLAGAKSGLAAVSTSLPPVYVMVDRSYPTIIETELNASSVFRSALFPIGGTIADTNALKSITVVQTKDGDPGSSQTVLSATGLSGVSDSWTVANMPFGGVSDGTYEYAITVTDASDKQTVLTRTVIIDTTAPGLPGLSSPVADSWLRNNPWNFSGTSSDGSGSGIAAVKITETAAAAAVPLKTDAVWADATIGIGGAWNHTVTIAATGSRTVHLYAIDVAGNESAIVSYDFGLDQSSPAVSFSDGTGIRYMNSLFTISGNYSDDSGLAGISVESSDDNVTFIATDPATASFNSGAGTWSWTKDPSAQTAGTWYYRFNFTDLAGNVRQETKTVNLDRTEPVLAYTASAPSIDFNAGAGTATANALMSLSGTVSEDQGLANLSSLRYRLDGGAWVALTPGNTFAISSIDVSGKYPSGTLLVEVEAADRNGNAAIESFTLNVDQASDKPVPVLTTPAEAATINLISISITGTVTDDDGINATAGAIQYRYSDTGLPGNYGPWTDILNISGPETSRNYSVTINSGSDGAKLLQLRSYDKFGVVSDTLTRNFSVDTGAPQFSALTPAMNSYHNNDFAVTGSVSDNTDVQTLRYRVTRDGIEVTAWTILAGTPATTVPINQNISTAAGSGQYEVFLEASDGTYTRTTSIRVYVDKSAPTVTFVSPAAASIQNNIITLSGTATDNYGIASLEFFIVDTGDVERALPTGTLSGTLNWSISGFDTRNATLLSYAEDLGSGLYEITVRAKAGDQAGNQYSSSGGNDLVFRFRQTDDRPVLAIDNVALDGSSLIDTTTITGTLQDDDGVATILIDTWNIGNSTATPDVTETVTLTSGALGGQNLVWRVNLANSGNGLRGLRIRVIDTVDNNGQDYSASDWSRLDTGRIDFRLDTIAPAAAFTTPLANSTWSSKNTFSVSGTSSDANGISGLKYKLDDNDFSAGTVDIALPHDNWSFVIDQAELADGPHTIYVQATDESGKTRVISRQVSVDKTGADIAVISPLNNAAVFGPLTISGTASDNAGGAGVKNLKIGLGNTIDATNETTLEASTWTDIPGTTSWSYSFLNINDFANTTYSVNTGDLNADGIEDVGETWTDLWNFKFYVRSEDNAGAGGAGGNISYLTTYTLQIDPKRDRPEVSILSPTDGATVGGFVRVFGSAFDSQFVEKVQIAISSDGDEDYTNDPLWTQGTLDETEAGVRWYLVSGTTSWNVRLNEAAEFDPTGGDTINTIRFKVRAKDYKVTPGDGIFGNEVEYSITFNKNFPQFSAMSINSGDTVGGTVIFEGLVRDESDLARIVFSNEGPLLNNTTLYTNPDPTGVAEPGAATTEVASVANPYGGDNITVSLLGTTDPEYSAAFPGSYRVRVPINTAAPGLYNNGAGSMSIKLTAEDNTTPQPFTNQYLVSFSVDNILPVNLTWTGGSELVGTSASLKGSVRDTGAVSGIDRVVVYLTNLAGELVSLQGLGSPIAVFDPLDVLDESNTTYDDYRMVIDNRLEDGSDGGSAGDNDGIPEWLVFSGGIYYWEGRFDSTRLVSADGKVSVHMVAEDFAGNQTVLASDSFIANNKPVINSIVLGTDLNGSTTVTAEEMTAAITSGYSATNFVARGNLLYIKVNAASGNGARRYSVKYDDIERNIGDLTNNEILIDTSGITDSTVANDRSFVILVYDTTDAGSTDPIDQLSATITVNLTVDNVDTVKPFAELYQLTAGDIKTSGTNPVVKLGHIEPWNQSPWNNTDPGFNKVNEILGNDADVSGTIILRGKVSDDQRLTEVWLSIDLNADGDFADTVGGIAESQQVATVDGSGLLVSLANSLGIISFSNQTLSQDNGHEADFAFEWDSRLVQGVARSNVTLAVQAMDARSTPNVSDDLALRSIGTGANPDSINRFQVDVVPYITKIATPNRTAGGLKDNNIRSSSGLYSVIVGANGTFITVSGFNLAPSAARIVDTATVNTGTVLDTSGSAIVYSNVAADNTSFSLSNNSSASGYLEVFTNGIRALNNMNNNAAEYLAEGASQPELYNMEPDLYITKNSTLSDDRYLRFFQMRSTGIKNGYYPEMVMVGNDPVFGFVNLTGGPNLAVSLNPATGAGSYYPSHAMPQRARFNGTTGAEVTTEYLIKASIWDQMGMAKDDADRFFHATVYNRDGASMSLLYDRYAELYTNGQGWGTGTTYSGYGGNTSDDTVNNAITLEGVNFGDGLLLGRFQYPKIVAKGNSITDHAKLYMLYYDDNTTNRELIFRNLRIGTDVTGGGTAALFTGGTSSTGQAYAQRSNLPDNNTTGRLVAATNASRHFDFAVTSDFRVILVYYDEDSGRLRLRYSTNPVLGNAPTNAVAWTDSAITFPDYIGNYVSMAMDSSNGIHIAAYDSSDSDLVYFYLPSYDSATSYQATIDASFSVGMWTSIKVKEDGGDIIPYIAYYNSSETGGRDPIKLAYSNSGITTLNVPAGVDASGFTTGSWEYLTVPAITPPQGGDAKFKKVNLDFDSAGRPILGYLGTNLEYGTWLEE